MLGDENSAFWKATGVLSLASSELKVPLGKICFKVIAMFSHC